MSNKPNTKKFRRMNNVPSVDGHRPGEKVAKANPSLPQPGAINAYNCEKCHKLTIVIHQDAGVTPMFLACRMTEGCEGMGTSIGYPPGPAPERIFNAVRFFWYRPNMEEYNGLSREMKRHISDGGLLLGEYVKKEE